MIYIPFSKEDDKYKLAFIGEQTFGEPYHF